MDTENMIEITGADLVEVVKTAYDLSNPQGLGFLHYESGGLTNEEAQSYIRSNLDYIALRLDYVKGRACKMTVFQEDGKLFIRKDWYDHTDQDLKEFLKRIKQNPQPKAEGFDE